MPVLNFSFDRPLAYDREFSDDFLGMPEAVTALEC